MGRITYGYIRVSSKEQNIDRQWDALLKHGIAKKNIFVDKQSGKTFNRPQYKRMIELMNSGDCLIITSLDRLGRNYTEIQEQWRIISKIQQVDIIVLDMPLLNTKDNHHNLMGRFLSDIILQILSYVAETERNNIKKRQAEGIVAAKARGVRFGRKSKPLPANFHQVVKQWRTGEITGNEAAKRLNVSRSWLYQQKQHHK